MKTVRLELIFRIGIAISLNDNDATASHHGPIHSYESVQHKNFSNGRKSGKTYPQFTPMYF